jgi:hypothetical protein
MTSTGSSTGRQLSVDNSRIRCADPLRVTVTARGHQGRGHAVSSAGQNPHNGFAMQNIVKSGIIIMRQKYRHPWAKNWGHCKNFIFEDSDFVQKQTINEIIFLIHIHF